MHKIISSYSGKSGTQMTTQDIKNKLYKFKRDKSNMIYNQYGLPDLDMYKFKSVEVEYYNEGFTFKLTTEGYSTTWSLQFSGLCVEDEISLDDIALLTSFEYTQIYNLPLTEYKSYIYKLYHLIGNNTLTEHIVKNKLFDLFYSLDSEGVIMEDGTLVYLKKDCV